ncbi:MAG: hypothetical protein HZB19_23165 [Chloroflexi bacterium]|nr:hypothetical protein [Chloroflexota bacterium]
MGDGRQSNSKLCSIAKKHLSDVEKTIITFWIFIGVCLGAVVLAPVLKQSPQILGVIGLAIGAGIGYAFFREPRKRKYRKSIDSSKWIGDKFSDILMKRIFDVYNVKPEPPLDEDAEDEIVDEPIDVEYDDSQFALSNEPSGMREDTATNFWQSMPLTSKILFGFSIFWPAIFGGVNYLFPDMVDPIKSTSSLKILFILPICFMTGLSGLLILLQQNTVDYADERPKGVTGFVIGILAIILGCGLGSYLILVDILEMKL